MLELIGHLHPLLVHLPIGILLIGLLLLWVSRKEKYAGLRQAAALIFGAGTITAFLSCITGYCLSLGGGYDEDTVSWHMWMAIGVTIASGLLYARIARKAFDFYYKILSLLVLILLLVTGHLGGSLTHGDDYLSFNVLSADQDSVPARKPIANVQEAAVYNNVVKPVLQSHCYSCHSSSKQKGKLRLDDQSLIIKGGKNGTVLVPGKADESELIKRILLPESNDDHMPPKEKPQLSANDVALLHWWIEQGADFNKKTRELQQPEKIKPALAILGTGAVATVKKISSVPENNVASAPDSIINALTKLGVVIMPVAKGNNYLSANFVTAGKLSPKHFQLIQALQKQLVWLKLSGSSLDDEGLKQIANLTSLTRLHIDRTSITDKGIASLQSLKQLQFLNLVGTNVTAEGLQTLKGLTSLQQLYLYQTAVTGKDWTSLQKLFPAVQIDSGNYAVASLASDTTVVKPAKK